MNRPQHTLHNWLPYKISKQEDSLCCNWLTMGEVPFDEPFFEHTILRFKALPENVRMFRQYGAMELLPSWAATLDTVTPAAFIFHVSRCGSTLVTQSLCMDKENIVLSEVPLFDEILRLPLQQTDTTDTQINEWLSAAIRFHTQKRTGTEKRAFIKTDCWHVFFYEKLRALFPDVPFIFLYRSPDEVLRSQQKRRGMQAVPGLIEPQLMGLDINKIDYTDFDGYFSQVLEKITEQCYHILCRDKLSLAVNYNEGIGTIMQRIAAFSGYTIDTAIQEKITERSRYHAKYPDQVFAEEQEKISIPPSLEKAMYWYRLLEEKRNLTASPVAG